MQGYKVIFQPGDLEVEIHPGSTIMEALNKAGIYADFPCGGRGKCGKCRVEILKGAGEPTAKELNILEAKELAAGIRLACLTSINDDLIVKLPNSLQQHNILITSGKRSFQLEPHLKKVVVEIEKPSLDTNYSDWHRVKNGLVKHGYQGDALKAPVRLLRQLPEALRKTNHCLTMITYNNEITGIEKQEATGTMLGMAFDIGTTTIVGYLLDLYSGQELSVVSTLNPQTKFGADVISRITFANQEENGLDKLHAAVLEAINKLIKEAAETAGINKREIYGVTIAANTSMHHLFLGISPRNIGVSPYVSAVNEPVVASASELQIDINQAGKIFVLPNIAGFVGADTTSVILAAELDRSEDIKLVIDIGTNGEIVLGSRERMAACSAAAGPAFEGAQISSGMRGADGAIDHVYFRNQLEYSVIGEGRPVGICGSALLDTVAGLLELGIINKRGKILSIEQITNTEVHAYKDHLLQYKGEPAFLLVDASKTRHGRPIMVTQNDIRELQLAKGAMAAGIRVLMKNYGIKASDIKEVLLAGAFGNYLTPHSACVVGLIPPELESRIKLIGNAAGTGSKLALLSSTEYRRAAAIAEFTEFVELGSYPKFNSIFAQCTYFRQLH